MRCMERGVVVIEVDEGLMAGRVIRRVIAAVSVSLGTA